ncbi:MAG: DUF3106 domain-containing protein [Verrucomicrobiota bacterium]|nr:DUF3106 domain-containing protein [Verrucomicrobiota bacterium]
MKVSSQIAMPRAVVGVVVCLMLNSASAFADTNRVVLTPPPPTMRSPVDAFRVLLALPTAERRQYLTNRTVDAQRRLVEKIHEYQALTPEEREFRLTATELRWYLLPLMSAPATNRAAQLALIPAGPRELVATRLQQWDQLPPPVQARLLTNQQAASYFASGEAGTNLPVSPADQIRRKLQDRFNQLLELTAGEKEKVLQSLSDAERRQMEKTLAAYGKLPPGQRQQCLRSFTRFATMSPAERQEFLKNAERWSQMSPAERQAWRELVSSAPTKPSLPIVKVPKPPVPRLPTRATPSVVTNGG